MKLRAVLLDLGDTVFRLDPLAPDIPLRIAVTLALDPERVASVYDAVRESVLAAFAVGATDEPGFDALFASHAAAAGLDCSAEMCAIAAHVFAHADIERFAAPEHALGTIEALRGRGVSLAAVSNTTSPPDLLDSYLARLGLRDLFDARVYSIELGVRKPHPAIYELALSRLGVAPEEALFVGDRVREDVLGPRAAGIRAVLTHEFRQEDPAAAAPEGLIRSLAELPGLLDDGAWSRGA